MHPQKAFPFITDKPALIVGYQVLFGINQLLNIKGGWWKAHTFLIAIILASQHRQQDQINGKHVNGKCIVENLRTSNLMDNQNQKSITLSYCLGLCY